MIYIPQKQNCQIYNQTKDGIYMCELYKKNDEFPILFFWSKENNTYDTFYIEIRQLMHDSVLCCPLNGCKAYPQLRFNKIINKWFCICPSSAICTKDQDESQLYDLFSELKNKYTEHQGFFNNPIEAILYWNKTAAKGYQKITQLNIKKFKNYREKNVEC